MFIEYFGFKENPFNLAADAAFFCLDVNRQKLCQRILESLQQPDCKPIVLTGCLGVGKSQFINYVESMLPDNIQSLSLADGAVTYSERIRLLVGQIPVSIKNGNKLVVIINNAQEIPDQDLISLVAGVNAAGALPIQFIFSGLVALLPKLEAIDPILFSAANSHRIRMVGLDGPQVGEYIKFRLQRAGYVEEDQGELFTTAAVKRIALLSQGIPHSINLLCGASLLGACFDNRRQVTESIVLEASLSCLLPVEAHSIQQPVNFPSVLPNPKPSFVRRRAQQRREFNQRMSNWKRLANVQSHQPITNILPPSKEELAQAKRKRLVRGVMALSISLSCLVSLQHYENSKGTPALLAMGQPGAMAVALQPAANKEVNFDASGQSVMASVGIGLVGAVKPVEPVKLAAVPLDKALEPSIKPVFKKVKTLTAAPKIEMAKAIGVAVDSSMRQGQHKESKANHLAKLEEARALKKMQAMQIVKAEIGRQQGLSNSISVQQASAASVAGMLKGEKEASQVSRYIDAQESAARDRAASRLNLDKLGVEYSVESLMAAARTGDVHVLKLLLAGGIPPDIKNSRGETALIAAARNGYTSVVKELLNTGAHPNVKDKQGLTASMHATQMHRPDISNLILSHGGRG